MYTHPSNSSDVQLQLDVRIHAPRRLDGISTDGRVGDRQILGLLGRQAHAILDDDSLVGEDVGIAADLVSQDDVLVGTEKIGHLLAKVGLPLLGIGFGGIVLDEIHGLL